MSNEITMPKLSDTMEEGKILRWLKRPGDKVQHGEALAEVETDKADMVLESFEEGVLQEIRLAEGESAPVGTVIAIMGAAGQAVGKRAEPEAASAPTPPPAAHAAAPSPAPPKNAASKRRGRNGERRSVVEEVASNDTASTSEPVAAADSEQAPPSPAVADGVALAPVEEVAKTSGSLSQSLGAAVEHARVTSIREAGTRQAEVVEQQEAPDGAGEAPHKQKASPLARRAAEEAGVDLSHIRGSGPEGRITKRDVDNFLREQQLFRQRRLVAPREGAFGSHEELSRMRRTIAQRMAASKREIPHFYVTVEVDMDEAVRFKKSLEATELFEEDISFNDIVIKACALALGRYPRVNSSFENEGITIHPSINIGMAVAVEDGLIVPVIKECQRLALPEISRAAHRLIAKAGQGGFTAEELSGGTFTISNMGMLGIEHFAAVINPPQAAILAVSAIKDRPVVRDGHLAVGKTMMITVSCDHRTIDGVVAGRFLQEVKRFLENPASLLV